MGFDDGVNKVFNLNFSCSNDDDDDDIDILYHEIYDSLVKVKKELKLKAIENESLLKKVKCLKNENLNLNVLVEQLFSQNKLCAECKVLKDKNLELIKSLQNFTNSKNKLDVMLENQHNSHNKKGLSFKKRRNQEDPIE